MALKMKSGSGIILIMGMICCSMFNKHLNPCTQSKNRLKKETKRGIHFQKEREREMSHNMQVHEIRSIVSILVPHWDYMPQILTTALGKARVKHWWNFYLVGLAGKVRKSKQTIEGNLQVNYTTHRSSSVYDVCICAFSDLAKARHTVGKRFAQHTRQT